MVRALLIITFLVAWFLPLIIAALYKLPHQGPIAVLSLLLGWTGVGWLAALVIAVGGAIRATRPPLVGQEQPLGPAAPAPARAPAPADAPTQADAPAQARWPTQAHWPAQAQTPERAPAPERAQPPQRSSSPWPDNPR
jgi:Superinfection immunity protein